MERTDFSLGATTRHFNSLSLAPGSPLPPLCRGPAVPVSGQDPGSSGLPGGGGANPERCPRSGRKQQHRLQASRVPLSYRAYDSPTALGPRPLRRRHSSISPSPQSPLDPGTSPGQDSPLLGGAGRGRGSLSRPVGPPWPHLILSLNASFPLQERASVSPRNGSPPGTPARPQLFILACECLAPRSPASYTLPTS